jgi:hypothetical protein
LIEIEDERIFCLRFSLLGVSLGTDLQAASSRFHRADQSDRRRTACSTACRFGSARGPVPLADLEAGTTRPPAIGRSLSGHLLLGKKSSAREEEELLSAARLWSAAIVRFREPQGMNSGQHPPLAALNPGRVEGFLSFSGNRGADRPPSNTLTKTRMGVALEVRSNLSVLAICTSPQFARVRGSTPGWLPASAFAMEPGATPGAHRTLCPRKTEKGRPRAAQLRSRMRRGATTGPTPG